MNWHTDCYTCTCTTSHHQPNTEFSRSAPRAAEKAADTRPSLLPVSAATIIHDQMYDGRRAGARSWGCGRHAPVRVNLFRGQGLPDELGRGRIALGPFTGSRGGGNRTLASTIYSAEHSVHDAVQPLKRHSKSPFRYVTRPTDLGARNAGFLFQNRASENE